MTFITEEQLESFIYENRNRIHEKGLPKFYEHTIRQFVLPNKKKIDLFSFEIKEDVFYCRIFELKKEQVWIDAIAQVLGYGAFVSVLTQMAFTEVKIELILIGSNATEMVLASLPFIPQLSIYNYSFGYDGILFEKKDSGLWVHSSMENFCNFLYGKLGEKDYLNAVPLFTTDQQNHDTNDKD